MHANLSFFQNVPPKAGTPGVVQESAPSGAPGGAPTGQAPPPPSMISMLFPFLILLPFVWMMFRRQKKDQAARASLKKGDRVVTQAGLVGELVELAEPVSKLKIAAGVTVEVLSSSLSPLAAPVKKDDVKLDAKVATEKK
ncbi:MAG: preprotein translocase subunit YajC [Myxococcales bacterium]|nr:preprotein translocase subunit YajC [Myxococcales bacterium]